MRGKMSVEIFDEIALSYVHWALEEGVWDGRSISWLESSDFIDDLELETVNYGFISI